MLRGFYLSLYLGPVLPIPAPQPVIDALTAAQVTVTAGQASGFQLTFALSKKSILNTVLLPTGLFDPGTRVILAVTVNSLPHVLMDGIITQHSVSPSNDPGQSTLTVTGQDLTLLMSLTDIYFPYVSCDTTATINLILLRYIIYGILPAVVPPLEADYLSPAEQYRVQNDKDLEFIQEIAKRVGYVFYIEPGPLPGANIAYFGPEIRVGVPQSALNVNMDAETNVESLSFTYDGLSRTQPVVTIFDPITGLVPINIPVPDVSLLRPPLALRTAASMKMERLDDVANLDFVTAALLSLSSAATPDAITGSGQLDVLRYGQPLRARQLVGVRGAGTSYDGLYYVSSVTHNIKRGEYKQSFSLAREGLISLTPVVVP